MKRFLYCTIVCTLSLLTSCVNEPMADFNKQNANPECSLSLTTDSVKVNEQEISNIVNSVLPKSRSEQGNYTLTTISDEAQKPLIYVINYKNNGGFVLISATKNFYPILAYNTTGNFNPYGIMPEGLLQWREQSKDLITLSDEFSAEEKHKFRNIWKQYENRDHKTPASYNSRSSEEYPEWYADAQTIVMNKRLELQAKGYEVYDFNAEFTSDKAFNEEVREFIRGYIYPVYDDYCEDLSIIAYNPNDYTETKVPNFVLSTWTQDSLYNSCYPLLSNGKHAYVGCGPLAVGQIMRHYQYPATYNWNDMPLTSASTTTSSFLLEVTQKCKGEYSIKGTSVYLSDCKDALISYGYSANTGEHDQGRVINNMKSLKPVIMAGNRTDTNVGHMWIASGLHSLQYDESYEVWTFNTRTDFRCATNYLKETHFNYLFYMNWGWNGNYNGFFNDNKLYIEEKNITYINAENIYDIAPKN